MEFLSKGVSVTYKTNAINKVLGAAYADIHLRVMYLAVKY